MRAKSYEQVMYDVLTTTMVLFFGLAFLIVMGVGALLYFVTRA